MALTAMIECKGSTAYSDILKRWYSTKQQKYPERDSNASVIAALKILHYPVVVCPKLVIAMFTSPSEGEILTIKQVATYLKVTERTIYRLAGAKKIPAFKVGGTWRFSKADIDAWIKQQSMEVTDVGRDEGGSASSQATYGESK